MKDVNFPQDFYLDDVGVWRLKKEKLAEMEKPKPMTNEEWLKQANTEQLAEWIAHQTMIALLENQNNHSLRMTYPAYWVEWLKQPHSNS